MFQAKTHCKRSLLIRQDHDVKYMRYHLFRSIARKYDLIVFNFINYKKKIVFVYNNKLMQINYIQQNSVTLHKALSSVS